MIHVEYNLLSNDAKKHRYLEREREEGKEGGRKE
jgi:hypothetical protein